MKEKLIYMTSIPFPEVNMFTWEDDSSVWMLEMAVRRKTIQNIDTSHMYDSSV
jgi:hypothetical protein